MTLSKQGEVRAGQSSEKPVRSLSLGIASGNSDPTRHLRSNEALRERPLAIVYMALNLTVPPPAK